MNEENTITIFTDGSSRGNPGPGGWGVVTIYPDSHGVMKVDELGGGEKLTTNNRMEIRAGIEGLKNYDGYYSTFSDKKFIIYTDSAYLINGATKWIFGWKNSGWITSTKEEVKNRDLWEELSKVMINKKIDWRLIKGHADVLGNERCDVIATSFADGSKISLFTGPFSRYPLQSIFDAANYKKGEGSSSSTKGGKAYSYVSMIDGDIQTDTNWADCERRVKGAKGARFKKALSKDDEIAIKKDFASKR